jgi:GMP synthase (glutamine-hydrolysing)
MKSSTMRVLIIENFQQTDLGQLGIALEEAGAAMSYCKTWNGDTVPVDLKDFDALIVMGGEQSAIDDDKYPFLPAIAALMRKSCKEDKAVLGVCLGSQLLARGFGAQNHVGTAPEFGWREITRTADGETDPVLGKVGNLFSSFEWHDDTFDLPENAIRLATSPGAANQAFRIGRAAYGMQFHFEASRKVVEGWNARFKTLLAEKQPGWLLRHAKDAGTLGKEADEAGLEIARAWVRIAQGAILESQNMAATTQSCP